MIAPKNSSVRHPPPKKKLCNKPTASGADFVTCPAEVLISLESSSSQCVNTSIFKHHSLLQQKFTVRLPDTQNWLIDHLCLHSFRHSYLHLSPFPSLISFPTRVAASSESCSSTLCNLESRSFGCSNGRKQLWGSL